MHTLLRSSIGRIYSFGEGRNGRLGIGDTKPTSTPTLIKSLSAAEVSITSICAAWAHSLAVDQGGGVWTWGNGGSGRLGHGNTLDVWQPRRVDVLHCGKLRVVQASSAYEHTAVCCSDGSVWMCGLGEHGQLGLAHSATSRMLTYAHICSHILTYGGQVGLGHTATCTYPLLLESLVSSHVKVRRVACAATLPLRQHTHTSAYVSILISSLIERQGA
jgi:alpha-tubulin suppressor-like RCC1 family protein